MKVLLLKTLVYRKNVLILDFFQPLSPHIHATWNVSSSFVESTPIEEVLYVQPLNAYKSFP